MLAASLLVLGLLRRYAKRANAALHNNQAAALLRPELLQYSYAPGLAAMCDANSGRAFQVGTGMARLLVVTANTCQGVRAYFGFASPYFEVQTDALQRLDDETWSQQLRNSEPASVGWLRDLMGQ